MCSLRAVGTLTRCCGTLLTLRSCPRCGNYLVDRYETFAHAGTIVSELILCIEGARVRLEIQIETLPNIWDSLDRRLQAYQNALLQHLQAAITELDGVIGTDQGIATSSLDLGGKKGALK